jgi:hypothetical protein
MFTSYQIIIPSCKEPCISKALAPPDLIRICQCVADSMLVDWKQIRMVFRYMLFTLIGKLDFVAQIWTRVACHHFP